MISRYGRANLLRDLIPGNIFVLRYVENCGTREMFRGFGETRASINALLWRFSDAGKALFSNFEKYMGSFPFSLDLHLYLR